jgi:ABC-2 type transport system permease protein
MLRVPAFILPTILLPTALFILLNTMGRTDPNIARAALATGIVFGSIAPGLFGVGMSLATDRAAGLFVMKRALPVPGGAYLLAKLCTAVAFASIIASLLIGIALMFEAPLRAPEMAMLLVVGSVGVLPFCATGMLVALTASPQAVPAITNLLYIALNVLSGIWLPLKRLPQALQDIAPFWPPSQLSILARGALSHGAAIDAITPLAMLFLTTIILFAVATWRWRRMNALSA